MSIAKGEDVLRSQLPEGFYEMARAWQENLGFNLKITSPRKTKLGDFKIDHRTGQHWVSVNRTTDKWSFLITFAHEAAHSEVQGKYGPQVRHHGKEWKSTFRRYLLEILSTGRVPETLSGALASYCKNPRASTYSYPPLVNALHELSGNNHLLLDKLKPGSSFLFKGQKYTYLDRRRTRALCKQESSGRNYLISLYAEINAST